jgi:predicted component of type VI protein secretion system
MPGPIESPNVNATTVTLSRIYNLLASCIATYESELNSAILRLESEDDIGQEQMLALQAKIQAWGNLTSTCTGLLRAVGDAIKTTSQNVR